MTGRNVLKYCSVFLVFILMFSSATSMKFNVNEDKMDISSPLSDGDTSSNTNALRYTFAFTHPTIRTIYTDNSDYTTIDISGCISIGGDVGKPILPVKPVKLLLPTMTTVKSISGTGTPVELTIDNYVYPYQNPVPIGFEQDDFQFNDVLYASDEVYPSDVSDDYHIGYSHGYAIMDITLNPVQYIPDDGCIFYYPEITVTLDLEYTGEMNQFFRNSPDDRDWVENLVYNPEMIDTYAITSSMFYPGGLCDPEDDYDYVIITTTYNGLDYWETSSSIPYNWESLMDKHEQDDGLKCTLVTIQDINACHDYYNSDPLFNDTEAHIREFCKDAYEDWGTQYIFVGGDDEWIPARHMKYASEGNVDSDIYWSNLDNTFNDDHDEYWGEEEDLGFDLYSELFIGRITCDTPQDVSNWMTKSFYYADSIDTDYLENAGFYGGDTGWPPCGSDDIIDFAAIKGFETWNALHPDNEYDLSVKWTGDSSPNPGWQGGSTSVAIAGLKNAINNDHVTLLNGIAHANAGVSLDVGMNSWESDYHNTKPFFIFDLGSHCGDMDAADDGVLHSMLFHSDTDLAFACVYNTCYGWGSCDLTNSSSAIQMKLFWDYLFDVVNNSGSMMNWHLGIAMAYSKDMMTPMINCDMNASGSWRGIIQGCLLFGDPAQRVKAPNSSPCYPVFNGTQGDNGIFITPVNVRFIHDPEIVAEIYYQAGSGEWTLYTEPFAIYEQGEIDFSWYWGDHNGNPTNPQGPLVLRIDHSPPKLALIIPEEGKVYLFGELLFEKEIARTIILGKIVIDVDTIDEMSGINNVTFSLIKNSKPPETCVLKSAPYVWELTGRHIGKYTLTVTAYDQGGLSVNTTLDLIILQFGIL